MQISVVAAIIFYQNKLLITRRQKSGNQDLSLKYEFPGGKVKKNERLKEALKRELKEETGLENVQKWELTYITNNVMKNDNKNAKKKTNNNNHWFEQSQ